MIMVDEPPSLHRFGHDEAWRLGSTLVYRCQQENLAVTICITLGAQRVFHAAMAGTSADNDGWAERKSRVVARFGCSSLAVYERHFRDNPNFFDDFALSRAEYAPFGGAVPIVVGGAGVGVLAISGLESAEDHRLAVAALRVEAAAQESIPATQAGAS
jgi:uncharacterized protein (UPF0303 family)